MKQKEDYLMWWNKQTLPTKVYYIERMKIKINSNKKSLKEQVDSITDEDIKKIWIKIKNK
jgi:hypothetical protein